MDKKTKQLVAKFDKAQVALREYAAAVQKMEAAYMVVGRFAQAEAPNTKGTPEERKSQIIAKFDEALIGLDVARDTLRVYLGDAIVIALKPDVRVMVQAEGAKVGEKASVELTLDTAKSYADRRKLAAAARSALGGKGKVAGSGAQPRTAAPVAVDTVKTHVLTMMKAPEGRALLQKWAGEVGIWLDFRAEEVKAPAPMEAAPVVAPKGKAKAKAKARAKASAHK